ncbi:MAG: hypothetical protein WBA77_12675 [Microcoleaceae cyanobacterium]
MDRIEFVTDQSGKPTAVIIDLEQWGDFWEDFYDVLVAKTRQNEPEISWEIYARNLYRFR